MKYPPFKKGLLLLLSSVLLTVACDKNTTETTTETLSVDTLKKEKPEIAPSSEIELSSKSKMVAKEWKAKELETPTAKLSDEFIDIRFNFKKDGTFEYSEDGEKGKGMWNINDKETMLILKYDNNMEVEFGIKELTEDKMIIAGEEHGMYRTYTLVPKK